MSNEKKQVKTNNLFEDSFLSVTRTFKKLFLADKITNTTAKICIQLFDYFSTESGRNIKYKNYSITKLRQLFGKENKPLSRSTLKIAIEQIKENNLFLIDSGFEGQEVMYSFYPRNLSTIELFEAQKQGLYYSKFGSTHHFYKNDNILSINHLVKDKNEFVQSENESVVSENQFTLIDEKKSFSENESAVCENESAVCKVPQTIINSEINESPKNLQESYIKETISKEALLQEPLLVNSENSSLEKKLLESELKVKAFLKSDEITKEEEKEIESNQDNQVDEIDLPTSKNDNELDRLKSILMCDYQIYENLAEQILKEYSIKAINDCIDLTIDAEVNDKIKSTPRDFLRNKLKYWTEKKETTQETSRPAISSKNISLPGEQDFINLFYTKKIVHISQKNLNDCVQALITCARKDIFLEIKEKFSREQIWQFINNFQNTFTFAYKYTNDVARFWQFFNDIQELDKYTEELRIKNEKSRLEILEKFKNSMKKDDSKDTLIKKIDSFSNLNDLIQDDDNENIPY